MGPLHPLPDRSDGAIAVLVQGAEGPKGIDPLNPGKAQARPLPESGREPGLP